MLGLFALALVAVVGLRIMSADERKRFLERARTELRAIVGVAQRLLQLKSSRDELRMGKPIAMVTSAILLAGLAMFAFGSGGSFGPRTTNGEWWRLATSMLVPATMFLLIVNAAALLTAAPLIERYLGTPAFIVVYVMTGLVAGVVNLWWHPVVVTTAASGPIFGLYGLMLASFLWNRASMRMRTMAVAIPAAAAFVAVNMLSDDLAIAAEFAAFGVGFAGGLLIARRAFREKPSMLQLALVTLGSAAVVVALAIPMRGIADVKPEIERVIALEDRTAAEYQATRERYTRGTISAEALAQQIDRAILPDLQEEDGRLKSLQRVPREHRALVADAEEYVRLRIESWTLRAKALRQSGKVPERDVRLTGVSEDAVWRMRAEAQYRTNLVTSGRAEGAERASREVLQRIKVTSEK